MVNMEYACLNDRQMDLHAHAALTQSTEPKMVVTVALCVYSFNSKNPTKQQNQTQLLYSKSSTHRSTTCDDLEIYIYIYGAYV